MSHISRNEQHITDIATRNGWHVNERDDLNQITVYRKHGRGYLSIYFAMNGRVVSARTARKTLTPNTSRVIEHLTASRGDR